MISFPGRTAIILMLGLLFSISAFGQDKILVERSVNKVILEGKVYYIHVVEPGHTLYAIAKAYNISQKEIAVENPGVISGIRIGQTLKIPVESSNEQEIDTSEKENIHQRVGTHKVKKGETFYSISKIYGVTQEGLQEANPSVSIDELRPGQRLLIPERKVLLVVQENAFNEEGFAYHKVKRKETLYSIARYYEVSVQDIRNANTELGWGGPKASQVIRIPLPQVIDKPESARDTIPVDSFLYAQGDTTMEAYHYEELVYDHDRPRRTYRIAFFIPFDFQEQEPLDSLIKDVESASRRNRIIERYRRDEKEPQSIEFLEFFQGSLLAIDSMRQTGMRLEVSYYDTKKSMVRMHQILEEPGMDDMDLIIGPFYNFNLEIASPFARRHKIPIVTPFYNEMTYLWDNPYLFQANPSLERAYGDLAKLVAGKHDHNIVYVREEDSLDKEKNVLLQELIFDGFDDYRPENPGGIKEMVLTLEHTTEIIHSLSKDKKNLVVVPTRNEALASRVVSSLYFNLNNFDIEVIGTPYWPEFSSIEYKYYHDLGLMFYSSFRMDLLDPKVDAFLERYRDHFYVEPRSMTRQGINYGIAGYDITLFFTMALRQFGPRFILSLDKYDPELVLDTYNFTRVSSAGGYENKEIGFYQFLPDMSIIEIEVPEPPQRNYFFWHMDNRKREYLNHDPQ
ncbi:MAG: LysM peptidoglycan-binding domain-containing protein [Bacteroidetes bacterium]|nr:LysM peptidoglycan-binding domain-containing protein [Bacteroidota bacterium]